MVPKVGTYGTFYIRKENPTVRAGNKQTKNWFKPHFVLRQLLPVVVLHVDVGAPVHGAELDDLQEVDAAHRVEVLAGRAERLLSSARTHTHRRGEKSKMNAISHLFVCGASP